LGKAKVKMEESNTSAERQVDTLKTLEDVQGTQHIKEMEPG